MSGIEQSVGETKFLKREKAMSWGGYLKQRGGDPLQPTIIGVIFEMGVRTLAAQPVSF